MSITRSSASVYLSSQLIPIDRSLSLYTFRRPLPCWFRHDYCFDQPSKQQELQPSTAKRNALTEFGSHNIIDVRGYPSRYPC